MSYFILVKCPSCEEKTKLNYNCISEVYSGKCEHCSKRLLEYPEGVVQVTGE